MESYRSRRTCARAYVSQVLRSFLLRLLFSAALPLLLVKNDLLENIVKISININYIFSKACVFRRLP